MTDPAPRRPALLVAAALVLTAAAVAVVVARPVRLGADDWRWLPVPKPDWAAALWPLALLALLGGVVLAAWGWVGDAGRLLEAALVAALVLLAFLVQVAVGRQAKAGYHESLFAVALPKASAYHEATRRIDSFGQHLRQYEAEVRRAPFRVQLSTHPAGPVVLFWGLNHLFAGRPAAAERFVRWCEEWLAGGLRLEESPAAAALFADMSAAERAGAWLATIVLRLAACLVLVPVYVAGRRLYGHRTALAAAGLSAAIPSLLLFSPGLDQAYPVLALTAVWLGYRAAERESLWRAVLCGLVVSVGLFLTLAFAVVAAWSGLAAVIGLWGRAPGRRLALAGRLLAAGLAGWLLPVAVLYGVAGYNSFVVWWACWEGNARFNALTQRSYWTWLWLNPLEFAIALGVPTACLFGRRALGQVWGRLRKGWRGGDWMTLLVLGLLVALDVLGANRGEVPRLWMFLMPACALAAAAELREYAPYRRALLAALFAAQAVQVVIFKATLNVLGME